MKIGLDYGGVISFSPDGWMKTLRKDFALSIDATDLSFADLKSGSQENEIADRKAQLCGQYGIEIFIDDDINRTDRVGRVCDRCAALYIPQNLWHIGQRLIDGLTKDW